MRYDIKEGTNFRKGVYLRPLCKVCPRKSSIAFVSVNKNPRLYGRGYIVNNRYEII